jgi:hypothetical protein
MTNEISLTNAERLLLRKGLEVLAASMKRQSRSALNPDVAAIYERNASQVNAFISKFA